MYRYIPTFKGMYLYIRVCTSTYQYILSYNLHLLVCVRLSSSMLLLIKPRKVFICTVYHMLQILVNRFKRFCVRGMEYGNLLEEYSWGWSPCIAAEGCLSAWFPPKICLTRLEKK
jgi:hypothetical protein